MPGKAAVLPVARKPPTLRTDTVPMLECRGVDVRVATRRLVQGLDLRVYGGSVLALPGPNGSGKSLSLHTIAGLRSPHAGQILI